MSTSMRSGSSPREHVLSPSPNSPNASSGANESARSTSPDDEEASEASKGEASPLSVIASLPLRFIMKSAESLGSDKESGVGTSVLSEVSSVDISLRSKSGEKIDEAPPMGTVRSGLGFILGIAEARKGVRVIAGSDELSLALDTGARSGDTTL